jgi:hypothetical protein
MLSETGTQTPIFQSGILRLSSRPWVTALEAPSSTLPKRNEKNADVSGGYFTRRTVIWRFVTTVL